MNNIFNYPKQELINILEKHGKKAFLATQIYEWLYDKKEYNPSNFANIKKENREFLINNFDFSFIKIEKVEEDIDAKKFLFRLLDGQKIEAVLMYHDYGKSICVSSQVGCNMGCRFCESGRLKKVRDLQTYEMVEQIILVSDYIKERIDSVVIMGIGEPFDNYDNVMNFIKIINDPKALAIGARHITVSTCGIVPKIKEFTSFPLQVNLAISLHAPNNEIRNKIMPINKIYPIEELIKAIKEYLKKTNRRVTFEYILLKDVNDSCECAEELASLVKGINCYINLIPYNETNNLDFYRTNTVQIMKFYDILKKNSINVTIRREFGGNISAACGQLRSKKEEL